MRNDGRLNEEIRAVKVETEYVIHPEGSVLISFGNTKVLCNASVEKKLPPWLKGQGKGWVTAEYSMLPRATNTRNVRESARGKLSGRTMEIQRLIGRTLRAVVDLEKMQDISIVVDCDVIQADGGTRTASVTGGFIALALAIEKLFKDKVLTENPIKEYLAAISVGMLEQTPICDLNYLEDSAAEVDMNVVMTESGRIVEIQGTGEEATFSKRELLDMLELAEQGINQLIEIQKKAVSEK